ncbi:MAG: hypothetical protein Harvfovirus52_7 [Harvfovirus sp.]|uniref:Sel1 repeat family protein n=1 Tax=Harvfovirus sp. TaxID=2487768 RepID=A0A3G5A8J3_9VIRU|nr:MAG: hypothetical protein Harvfovirus52_7 [Harvfovirus sp.]
MDDNIFELLEKDVSFEKGSGQWNKVTDHQKLLQRCAECERKNGAMFLYMGLLCFNKRDEALDLYSKAAALGNDIAMFRIGLMYNDEIKDEAKAMEWYKKAAELGNSQAMNNIGFLEKDSELALEWYVRAVKQDNNVDALCNLGVWYEGRDLKKAVEYFTLGVKCGDDNIMDRLKKIYIDNKMNDENVILSFELQGRGGNVKAMKDLGDIYVQSVPANVEKSLEWYTKAAAENSQSAMNAIGLIYEEKKDMVLAKQWFINAIKLGCCAANMNMGRISKENKNYLESVEYYSRAFVIGSDDDKKKCTVEIKLIFPGVVVKIEELVDHFCSVWNLKKEKAAADLELEALRIEVNYRPGGVGAVAAEDEFNAKKRKLEKN